MDGSPRSPSAVSTPPRSAVAPRRRWRRLARDTVAVTPVVGTIMILAISAFGIGVVMTWGLPGIKQTQAEAEIDSVTEQFLSVEEMMHNVMRSGASGKASSGGISFSQGEIKRTDGTLMIASAHHVIENPDVVDSNRYRITVTDPGDPLVLEVEARDGAETANRYVDAYGVDPDSETLFASQGNWVSDVISLSIDRDDIGQRTLRVRVMHEADAAIGEPEDFTLMQGWALPLGAVEYARQTPFGVTGVVLEMGSVITEYETGRHIHTDPLIRREGDADPTGETRFLSIFAPTLTGGEDDAAFESTGPGTHSLRLKLTLNLLQIPGQDVRDVDLHIAGDRSQVWYEYFEENQGFSLEAPDGPIERAIKKNENDEAFEFALMESRFVMEMLQGVQRIDA